MIKQWAAVRLNEQKIPVETVGYWLLESDAAHWANLNWSDWVIVPYWRIGH